VERRLGLNAVTIAGLGDLGNEFQEEVPERVCIALTRGDRIWGGWRCWRWVVSGSVVSGSGVRCLEGSAAVRIVLLMRHREGVESGLWFCKHWTSVWLLEGVGGVANL